MGLKELHRRRLQDLVLVNPYILTAKKVEETSLATDPDLWIHYKFDGNTLDSSGNTNDSVVAPNTSYVTNNVFGRGVFLNGTARIELPASSNRVEEMAIHFVAKGTGRLFTGGTDFIGGGWNLQLFPVSKTYLKIYMTTNPLNSYGGEFPTLPANYTDNFYSYCLNIDFKNNTFSFWLNGILIDSYTVTENLLRGTSQESQIGTRRANSGTYENLFNGEILDFAYFKRGLKETEIKELAGNTEDPNNPNAVTNLSIGTKYATALQLNFTPPSSVNGIDFYECYANGIKKNDITASGAYITGLNPDTTYTITVKAVDIFYNKSEFSNWVSETTNATEPYPISDIISYYKLEENAVDSNNINNGIPTAITYSAGKIGNAASFNGSTSFINVGNANLFKISTGTISCWIKTANAGSGYRGIMIKQGAYGMFLKNNNLIGFYWIAPSEIATNVNLADNMWHHVAMTFDSIAEETKVYIDGILKATGMFVISSQTKALVLGQGTDSGSLQNFAGLIDGPAVFDKVLSQSEITEVFNMQNAGNELI